MCLGLTSNLPTISTADLTTGGGVWLAAGAVASVSQAALTQVAASAGRVRAPRGLRVVLTLALLCGLLTFPTTCQCGDVLPHPHVLFLLPGHYHGGPLAETPAGHQVQGPLATASGPQLQAPAVTPAFGEALAAALALAWLLRRRDQLGILFGAPLMGHGRSVTPDPPPPRVIHARPLAVVSVG